MVSPQRKGFTLIELLVVIAIIAILAAMLFPVFARARESARKIQCLSNVKNIAMSIQMYLTDYDRFPPKEHRPEALDYLNLSLGSCGCKEGRCNFVNLANPYLTWPVLLDEYIKNRDVWNCSSARHVGGATWIIPEPDWLAYLKAHEGQWGHAGGSGIGPCAKAWPKGWGGDVTDSLAQQRLAVSGDNPANGAFVQGIGLCMNYELKTGQVDDPSWFAVCGDAGTVMDLWAPQLLAYPETCRLICPYCPADWEGCPDTQSCGAPAGAMTDVTLRKQSSRHLGGSNVGFMDGHAAWMPSEGILDACGTVLHPGKMKVMGWDSQGKGAVYPTNDCLGDPSAPCIR